MRRNIIKVHERTKRKTLKSVNIFGYLDFFMYLCHVNKKNKEYEKKLERFV